MTRRVGDVAVHDLGGDGRPLVISHATGFHGYCYAQMAQHLGERFACTAFDYRGHGDTPLPSGWKVEWSGFGDDAEAVVADLAERDDGADDHDGVVGFGHSMGGACLLMVAHRRPGLLSRLVLFEPVVPPPGVDRQGVDPSNSPLVAAALRRRETFASYDAALANFSGKPPLSVFEPAALWDYVRHGFTEQPDGSVRLMCAPTTEAATFAKGGEHDTWDLLGSIDIPVLVVAGAVVTDNGPALMAPAIADALPRGELRRLDGVDHFAPMSHPELVADTIRSFT